MSNLAMYPFLSRLASRVETADSLLCVGIDPHPGETKGDDPEHLREFCLQMVEATCGSAAAFKPNIAFFERYGAPGLEVLHQVMEAIPENIPIILDAKRGDISSTAEAYAQAAFHTLGADAVTAHPYLGRDALEPFLSDPSRGVFLLCKTSNPGSEDLQDLKVLNGGNSVILEQKSGAENGNHGATSPQRGNLGEHRLYEKVALLARAWNTHHNLGLVVGATHPLQLSRVRELAPDLWFLVPGVGTQGGDLKAALKAGLRGDGSGLLINVSRSISRAPDPGKAAAEWKNEINRFREIVEEERRSGRKDPEDREDLDEHKERKGYEKRREQPAALSPALVRLADSLLEAGCVKFGEFKLKSGNISPIYLDLRRLISSPALLAQVASAFLPLLSRLEFTRLAGLPYAALPIATAISLLNGVPMIYPRKEVKTHGTRAEIEGDFFPGEKAVVIDDLATTGGSKFEAIEKLTSAGLQVQEVAVLIDRQSGAAEALSRKGISLQAVFTLTELLHHWERTDKVSAENLRKARSFIEES